MLSDILREQKTTVWMHGYSMKLDIQYNVLIKYSSVFYTNSREINPTKALQMTQWRALCHTRQCLTKENRLYASENRANGRQRKREEDRPNIRITIWSAPPFAQMAWNLTKFRIVLTDRILPLSRAWQQCAASRLRPGERAEACSTRRNNVWLHFSPSLRSAILAPGQSPRAFTVCTRTRRVKFNPIFRSAELSLGRFASPARIPDA